MIAGVEETPEMWEKPTKRYDLICHAEFNAICMAAENGISLKGCCLYVTNYICLPCAKMVVRAGIKAVIQPEVCAMPSSNGKDFEQVIKIFRARGIDYKYKVEIE
jgi:dCMP deaminase